MQHTVYTNGVFTANISRCVKILASSNTEAMDQKTSSAGRERS